MLEHKIDTPTPNNRERPVCPCGKTMIKIAYRGYYDRRDYWECPDANCVVIDDFEVDEKDEGCYA